MNTFNQFDINICKDIDEKTHQHTDVEVLYVIDGSIDVKIKDYAFTMNKDDVLVINSSIQHSISSREKNIVCSIKYDYQIMVHILKKPNSFFLCNSAVNKEQSYLSVQKACRDIIYQEAVANHKTDSLKYSYLYQLLDLLVEYYLLDDKNPEISENYDADEKLQLIIHYVHQNYQDGISLSDLAKQMYTSTSTLSRLFKKQTGTYFAEYVNQVRTRYAIDELLYTEKNMTKIAMDCGFSNASAFTKVFREIYNMAPTEYRLKMKETAQKAKGIDESIVKDIQERYEYAQRRPQEINEVFEVVDVRKGRPIKQNWNKLINVGFVQDLLSANIQYHVKYLATELRYEYGRIWMPFNARTMVTDGVTVGRYNFDTVFRALDFMVENHIKPWIDFTNRPYTNAKSSSESVWFENLNIKFETREVWAELYKAFFKSIVNRYGMHEVKQWKFELGPEVFHKSYDADYAQDGFSIKDVYEYLYVTAKHYIPECEVGYNAAAGFGLDAALDKEIVEVGQSDFKPDFYSFILFPYTNSVDFDSIYGSKNFVRSMDNEFEKHKIEEIQTNLVQAGLGDVKIYISEWNITVSNSNYLNDSVFRAAVFIRNAIRYAQDIDVFGLWMASDWSVNSFSSRNIINGCGGIVTKDTIRKPIYYAVRFLNHLGDEVIEIGENYVVTKIGDDEYQVLFFNPEFYNANYFVSAESQDKVDETRSYFDMSNKRKIGLELKGVSENSWYYVKKRDVNSENASVMDEWGRFDYDTNLTRVDIKYLQEMCVPNYTRSKVQSKNGVLRLDVELEPEEFCALHVFPAD